MAREAGGRGAAPAPRSLDELRALRTDYEDVPVSSLGGNAVRLYALSGAQRSILLPQMAELSKREGDIDNDPEVVRRVFTFQSDVVAASMGYPPDQWAGLADALGAPAIEELYDVAKRLSGLGKDAVDEAVADLGETTSAGSGTD